MITALGVPVQLLSASVSNAYPLAVDQIDRVQPQTEHDTVLTFKRPSVTELRIGREFAFTLVPVRNVNAGILDYVIDSLAACRLDQ